MVYVTGVCVPDSVSSGNPGLPIREIYSDAVSALARRLWRRASAETASRHRLLSVEEPLQEFAARTAVSLFVDLRQFLRAPLKNSGAPRTTDSCLVLIPEGKCGVECGGGGGAKSASPGTKGGAVNVISAAAESSHQFDSQSNSQRRISTSSGVKATNFTCSLILLFYYFCIFFTFVVLYH